MATRNDEGGVQRNESALARNAIAQSGVVDVPDQLCPITVHNAKPSLDKGILDAIEKGRGGIEIRQSHRFQFKTLAGKVRINELFDGAFRNARSIDCGEISEHLAGCLVGRFVDKGLRIRVQLGEVYGLAEKLLRVQSLQLCNLIDMDICSTHCTGADYLAGTPQLDRWEGDLRG